MKNTSALKKLAKIREKLVGYEHRFEYLYISKNGEIISTDGDISIFVLKSDDAEIIENEGKVLCKAEIRKKKEGEEIKIREMNEKQKRFFTSLESMSPESDKKRFRFSLNTKFLKHLLENFEKTKNAGVIFEISKDVKLQPVHIFSDISDNKAVIMPKFLSEKK